MNRALLGLCLLLQLVRVVGQDMEEVATVERTVWDNLILASSKEVASRAGITLIRLWEEDGEALCHLTQVLASKSLILLADGACRQAERASPLLPCALACRAHFALWGCDFDLADDISRSLRGEMARRGEQGIPLGHVEALMLLPHRQFLEFMGAQARSLRAREEGEDGEDGGGNKFAMKVCESLKSRVVQVNLAILAAHPHDHPHGQVLLGALLGWKELRNRNVLSVTCYKTSAGAGGAGAGAGSGSDEEVKEGIRHTCSRWVASSDVSSSLLARRINAAGTHILLDIDGWSSGSSGPHHVLVNSLRPSCLSVAMLGVVGSTGVGHAYDFLLGDPVASPPEYEDWFAEKLLLLPRTYFLSPPPPSMRIPPDSQRLRRMFEESVGINSSSLLLAAHHPEYKISREYLTLVSKLLLQLPSSFLWLPPISSMARQEPLLSSLLC
uniref:O-GlcNAc transferase C-terminal domain-containing protein n=1 Tax=Guillardia theta TaxID=55529 RepID=A0A7S4P2D6_GUITH|mmetsp:Transcript_41748/g.131617  ORF Transcript_41748/g.131617 Transcript_41748/m.131617 type:complete len:442 (+) Transcript_41748:49-1374(+)